MNLKLFKKNLFGVAHILRFGRYGSIIRSVKGEIKPNDPIKTDDVNSNELEVLTGDESSLSFIRSAGSEGYTHLPEGPEKERNKKRLTNREELETDFVRKTIRNRKQLEFEVLFSTPDGKISPINFRDSDILPPYNIPQGYTLESVGMVCKETFDGISPELKISMNENGVNTTLLNLLEEDLTSGEKNIVDVYHTVEDESGMYFNIEATNILSAGKLNIFANYYGEE